MSVNKVVINKESGAETLIDLTGDTVTSTSLAAGETAHDASGRSITGTMPTTTVLYTEQTLTDAQKAQARSNIGADVDLSDIEYRLGNALTPCEDALLLEESVMESGTIEGFGQGWQVLKAPYLKVGEGQTVPDERENGRRKDRPQSFRDGKEDILPSSGDSLFPQEMKAGQE